MARVETVSVPPLAGVTLAALTVLLVWLGVYPAPLIALIRSAIAGAV
jgi:NADH:ubiquinone oxidoreductase subunit 4 (subunit M)